MNHPPSESYQPPSIAVIGMEGSGKTVLATTLAKRLSTIDGKGVFMNPLGVQTLKYVEKVWNILQNRDWPPSTPPGTLSELVWKFQVIGELECELRLIDAAGQDLRLLFEDEKILSDEPLPQHLEILADYCRSADIILFLVNLGDFLGEGDHNRRVANDAAIKSAMDYLSNDGKQRGVCLVLTQADLYKDLAQQKGGWEKLAEEAIPYAFQSHVRINNMKVIPVAAVAETVMRMDENGNPLRVPAKGFKSAGFNKLVAWLCTEVSRIAHAVGEADANRGAVDYSMLESNVFERVVGMFAEHFGMSKELFSAETPFATWEGDSSRRAELMMKFEDEFHIDISSLIAEKFKTVGEVVEYITGTINLANNGTTQERDYRREWSEWALSFGNEDSAASDKASAAEVAKGSPGWPLHFYIFGIFILWRLLQWLGLVH